MKKNLTDKIILRRSSLPKIKNLFGLPLIEKEIYEINREYIEKIHLTCSLPYSFE